MSTFGFYMLIRESSVLRTMGACGCVDTVCARSPRDPGPCFFGERAALPGPGPAPCLLARSDLICPVRIWFDLFFWPRI
jgi:hypothetical protein